MTLFSQLLRQAGYVPYYLYRQIHESQHGKPGLCQAGRLCLYNIQMIEERQTIIGLGGGAGSKFIDLEAGRLDSFYNQKSRGLLPERR